MAVLADQDRFEIWADFMRQQAVVMQLSTPVSGLLKADLRAAVDALDNFLVSNEIAINNAIPQPARAALTTEQKAALLMYVVARRYLTGV